MNKKLDIDKKSEEIEKNKSKKLINRIIFIGGFISLIIGLIGIAIPILPTTPFLLLASGAFARSSERFNRWLLNNKILGAYIKNYREGKGLSFKIKFITLSLLWITIIITLLFIFDLLLVQILLICIAIAVSIHIILIKPKHVDKNLLLLKCNNYKNA